MDVDGSGRDSNYNEMLRQQPSNFVLHCSKRSLSNPSVTTQRDPTSGRLKPELNLRLKWRKAKKQRQKTRQIVPCNWLAICLIKERVLNIHLFILT